MEESKLKNMVVLKNLPSNLVEEAIVILKSSKKVKKLEKIEKTKDRSRIETNKKENHYVLKEAEMLILDYINQLESENKPKKEKNAKVNKKYIRLKKYAYISSVIIFIQAILLLVP